MLSEHAVQAWFRGESAVVDEADVPTGDRLQLLTRVARQYEQRKLVEGQSAQPLWRACPRCQSCWANAQGSRPPEKDGRSAVSLPWIGPRYRSGIGVAVVGMNLRDAGGLVAEYAISAPTAGDGSQWSVLAGGGTRPHGSSWAYRSLRSSGAVSDWVTGRDVRDREDPRLLPEILDECVRLQAVKCSPADQSRSSPTPAMVENCPPFLLDAELRELRPAAIVGFGLDVYDAFRKQNLISDGNDYLAWGSMALSDRPAHVFWLYHPAGQYWTRSHEALLRYLRTGR